MNDSDIPSADEKEELLNELIVNRGEHELLEVVENGSGGPIRHGGTFNGIDEIEHDENAGSPVGHVVIDALRGLETELRLVHTRGREVMRTSDSGDDRDDTLSDYLVFGTWERRTGADKGPRADPQAEVLVAGSLPFANEDLPTTGDARYEGKALGHYKRGKTGKNDKWNTWNGTVELKANFSRGTSKISGTLKTGIEDGTNSDGSVKTLSDINLNRLTAGGSGKVSGVGTGTWEAGFYGTTINGAPNGVAGSFKTEREKARPGGTIETENGGVTTVTLRPEIPAMIVQGAFGAHHVGQLEDRQQQGE